MASYPIGSESATVIESSSATTGTTPYFFAMSAGISFTTPESIASALMWQYFSPNWSATVPRTSSSPMAPLETSTSSTVSFSARIDLDAASTWSCVRKPRSTRSCSTYSSLLVISAASIPQLGETCKRNFRPAPTP